MENTKNRKFLFENETVPKAVLTLAIPTIISQLITIIYNWADTFFVGQLNDTFQMAAVTICHPAFMMCTAFANLIGIGGANVISRAMGSGKYERAKKTSTMCLLFVLIFSLVYSTLIYFIREPLLLNVLGADETTLKYCYDYMLWVVVHAL